MEVPADAMLAFIENITRADTMAELESRLLDGVGYLVPASAVGMYVLNPFNHGTESVAARGVSDFFLSRYEDSGRHQDPVLKCALTTLKAVDNQALMTPEAWTSLPVYTEVFALHRMANLLQAPIVSAGRAIGTLNFGRCTEEGRFTTTQRQTAHAVGRLVGVAIEAMRTHEATTRENHQVRAALELCADAIVLTDLAGARRVLNAAARTLLGRLDVGESALEELMLHPVRRDSATRHEIRVTLESGAPVVLAARSTSPAGDPNVVISFLELVTGEHRHRAGLLQADGLTQRERQVAELAAGGLHDHEIAAQLFLSHHTVKQYLKAVYAKLGVRSRVELNRLEVTNPPVDPSDEGVPNLGSSERWPI